MKKCTFCDFCEENVTESSLTVSIGRRNGVVAYKMMGVHAALMWCKKCLFCSCELMRKLLFL